MVPILVPAETAEHLILSIINLQQEPLEALRVGYLLIIIHEQRLSSKFTCATAVVGLCFGCGLELFLDASCDLTDAIACSEVQPRTQ